VRSRESPRCAPGTLLNRCRLHKTKKHTMMYSRTSAPVGRFAASRDDTRRWERGWVYVLCGPSAHQKARPIRGAELSGKVEL